MKSLFVILLFVTFALLQEPARAQNKVAPSTPGDSCGPANLKFEVEHDNSQLPPSDPEPGKALVYVIEVFDDTPGPLGIPTVRVGLDGSWVGANSGSSYLFFSVDPGEHHLCNSSQSNLKRVSGQRFATDFTAEAGKTYFFEAQVHVQGSGGAGEAWSIDLHPVTADDAKYLIANSPLSVSHPKK
jgi:hypothetical protein